MTGRARAIGALTLYGLATGACLPRGDAPAGRQVLADRTCRLLGLVPANGDGVLRALFLRPRAAADDLDLADLYALSVDEKGGPSSERLLLTGVDGRFQLGCPRAGGRCYALTAGGKLDVPKDAVVDDPVFGSQRFQQLFRVDPLTGDARDIGFGSGSTKSPSGERALVNGSSNEFAILEADDSALALAGSLPQFVGEDLIYLAEGGELMRVPPGAAPVRLATGVSRYDVVNEHLLLLIRSSSAADPSQSPLPDLPSPDDTAALLDPATLEETPLPSGLSYQFGVSFSSDARWISTTMLSEDPNVYGGPPVLYDRLLGTTEALPRDFFFSSGWRPGRAELWASPYNQEATDLSELSVFIKRPGEPIIALPGLHLGYATEDGTSWKASGGPFTSDGVYFFSQGTPLATGRGTSERIGLADDPAGAKFAFVPPGSSTWSYWRLDDGRFLVESFPGQDVFKTFDVRAVDPRTGAVRVFGERGIVASVGRTRSLGIFHVSYERGDLTSTDFASGQSTVLAREFAMEAFTEPTGADAYPAGGRVLYQFRARFESPWDGLWLATVP